MSSKDYDEVMAGIEVLINKRAESNHFDRYSIIQFGTTAELKESDVLVTKPFVKPR